MNPSPLQSEMLVLVGNRQSRALVDQVADLVGGDAARMLELWEAYQSQGVPIRQRLVWAFCLAAERWPALVAESVMLERIILALPDAGHDAERRGLMQILTRCRIPEQHQGLVYDLAYQWLENPLEAVANRVQAMEVLFQIGLEHQDLLPELRLSLATHLPYGSAGFVHRAKELMGQIGALLTGKKPPRRPKRA